MAEKQKLQKDLIGETGKSVTYFQRYGISRKIKITLTVRLFTITERMFNENLGVKILHE